ncbi:hypothetical protein [Listeria aquatica]
MEEKLIYKDGENEIKYCKEGVKINGVVVDKEKTSKSENAKI